MPTPTLTTDRLVLRPLQTEDAPAIQEHFARWSIIQHLSTDVPWPYPADGAETFIRSKLRASEGSDDRIWAITERGAPGLIGLIEYMSGPDLTDHRGFWLGEPWQGRGYMTESITAVQDYLFFDLDIDRILVLNALDNSHSRRVKEKTGARYLGQIPFAHRNGCTVSEQWEVTRESWAEFRGRVA